MTVKSYVIKDKPYTSYRVNVFIFKGRKLYAIILPIQHQLKNTFLPDAKRCETARVVVLVVQQ